MWVAIFITSLLGLCLLLLTYFDPKPQPVLKQPHVSDPATCLKILACTSFDGSGDRNTLTKVESRAGPNQRLVRAFDIDNAFTTIDEEYRKAFRATAVRKLALSDGDWARIAGLARDLFGNGLMPPRGEANSIRLDCLVQSVSLKVALHVLFGLDPHQMDDEAILKIASEINNLWVKSKQSQVLPTDRLSLTGALAKILPEIGLDPKDNPLNLILPAYETLWRVVLFCFIEMTFRKPQKAEISACQKALFRHLTSPTKESFEALVRPEEVSAAFLVNEVLRLYPPTKRVYREFRMANSNTAQVVAADIEACHRIPSLWGDDSRDFRPSRWGHVSAEARAAFMPFGGGGFICPAKVEFGPRLIGILVGALCTHISPSDWTLLVCTGYPHDGVEFRGDEELLTGRGDYEWMKIIQKTG